MSPVIRVSEEVYKRLEGYAVGFDTPANVIERLLDQHEGKEFKKDDAPLNSNKITESLIVKIYALAKDVFEQKISTADAQTEIVDHLAMHPGSAMDYIRNFQKMMAGECYQRTMNGLGTEYYLKMIRAEYGVDRLKKALSAVEQHIQYYEMFSNGKLRNIRQIHDKYLRLV